MFLLFLAVFFFNVAWTVIIVRRLRHKQIEARTAANDRPPPSGDDGIVFLD
jgi:hypothetical protein